MLAPGLIQSIQFLRDLEAFLGVRFKLRSVTAGETDDHDNGPSTDEVVVSCVGIGFSNVNKAMA